MKRTTDGPIRRGSARGDRSQATEYNRPVVGDKNSAALPEARHRHIVEMVTMLSRRCLRARGAAIRRMDPRRSFARE